VLSVIVIVPRAKRLAKASSGVRRFLGIHFGIIGAEAVRPVELEICFCGGFNSVPGKRCAILFKWFKRTEAGGDPCLNVVAGLSIYCSVF
jgi:hypothetical protein